MSEESQQNNEKTSRLKFFPVMMFAVIMGFSGITLAYKKAHEILLLPAVIYQVLSYITAALAIIIGIFYLIKIIAYTNEVKITFRNSDNAIIELSQAINNNLWAYSLSHNIEYNFDNNLYLRIPFNDLNVQKGKKIEFCFITSVFDKTEEVCPQDLLLSLIRPNNDEFNDDEENMPV